jgi:hypothetical protein
MKKIFLIVIVLLSFNLLNAQQKTAAVKLGLYSPQATNAGFVLGYQGGKDIDENFEYGWSIDWFNKNYVDKKLEKEFDLAGFPNSELNELRAKTNVHNLPIVFSLTGRYSVNRNFDVYVSGGFGVDVLLIFYRSYQNPDEDNLKIAGDFAYVLSVGGIAPIGSRSEILAELTYHSSMPSWQYEVESVSPVTHLNTKKVFERVFDMSGIMARIGFKFYY